MMPVAVTFVIVFVNATNKDWWAIVVAWGIVPWGVVTWTVVSRGWGNIDRLR